MASATQRVTNEQIIQAYRQTGSVWKAAKVLGLCGQSVWERLRALNHPMSVRRWTNEEVEELKRLVETSSAHDIAKKLGRPFSGVAGKMSQLGLYTRRKSQRGLFPALKRGSGITRDVVKGWARDILPWKGTIRQFAVDRGLRIETLVQGLQRHYPDVWQQVVPKLPIPPIACVNCKNEFVPATKKQRCCSRRCTSEYRIDQQYFGGNRKRTIGLAEGVCQLCQRHVSRGLSSHHVIGKENDPNNELLIALCMGCHQVIGTLATRTLVDTEEGWERLIEFVLMRRLGANRDGGGFQVAVDIDWLTAEDIADIENTDMTPPPAWDDEDAATEDAHA
jgi:hypothetical protein